MSNYDTVVLDGEFGLFTKVTQSDIPYYTGETTVTPSGETQTLQTADTIVTSNITVNAVEAGSATTPDTTITATPSISVGADGLITAAVSATESVTPTVVEGYVESGTSGTITVSGSATEQLTVKDSDDLTASGATVTAPAGFYAESASKSVASGTEGTPTATKGSVSNHSVSVTPSVTNTAGYISGGTHSGTAVSVSAAELVSGNKAIVANGTDIDVTDYATVSVAVPGQSPTLETAEVSYTPTESEQTDTVTPSTGYDGLAEVDVTVAAIPSDYVGSGITQRDSTDLSASGATVTAPAGYYETAASASIASGSATTPATSITANTIISVNSSTGVITATASASQSVTPTVSAGYVASGTAGTVSVSGSATEALSTQAAQTITPTTTDQTIAAGKYLTGAQTVEAVVCENLTAANIVQGVTVKVGTATDDDSVASVTGTASGGGGLEDEILTRSITGVYYNDSLTTINNALLRNSGITGIELPNLVSTMPYSDGAFSYMPNLTSVKLPKLATPNNNFNHGMRGDTAISSIALPVWTGYCGQETFNGCTSLAAVDLSVSRFFATGAFGGCTSLTTLILRSTSVVVLGNTNNFNSTPFASGGTGGTIYIPKTLYDHLGDGTSSDYKAASNWSTINGYGTITWAKIEGSIYETQYADGTTIPTS